MDSSLWLRCSEMLQTSKWAIDGGVNVEWWTQRPDGAIDIWVYERGVGPTLACGTGACAVFAVLESTGVPNGGQLYLPGGPLQMSFSSKGHVLKCGPARWICYGIWGQPVASSKMSDEERKLLQSVMDDVHHQFIQAVADGRSLELSEVEPLADGRIFTGRQAKEARLVDELGDLEDAIRIAAEVAGIEGEPKVVEPRKRFSVRDMLESRWSNLFPKLDLPTGVNLKYLMAF